ncbi:hypothetical protein KO506_08375 [Polaribacter vadi]|uniref:hypothetical protein n=1 Tax=Polaribacter TaxID=52959 RepID=UPI001C08F7E1|nr:MULTISPECIES: hypothetical protein [Polaribacter]MBU3011415.1 hypothetical protein [Polaribacter vadi]MDO6741227.1 hypothetical protein [Polaribacter sp. 1_MG-2023]
MKQLLIIISVLMSITTYAHQSNLSTVIFSQADDGKYIIQINSSLTAFEGEIEYHYTKDSYKTPEEFKRLVIQYFEKNFSFSINGVDSLKLVNPAVILGHETKLLAEVIGVPKDIKSLYLKNRMFKDMRSNKSIVIMLIEGFPKQKYVLNNDNNQQVKLVLEDGIWKNLETSSSSFLYSNNSIFVGLLILISITVVGFFLKRKKSVNFKND